MFNAVEVEVEALEMRILDFGGCREDAASLKRLYFRISCRRRELGTRAAACGAHDPAVSPRRSPRFGSDVRETGAGV